MSRAAACHAYAFAGIGVINRLLRDKSGEEEQGGRGQGGLPDRFVCVVGETQRRWSCVGICRRCDWLHLHHVTTASRSKCIPQQSHHTSTRALHLSRPPPLTPATPQTTLHHPAFPPQYTRCTAGCCAVWAAACSDGGTPKGSGGFEGWHHSR